MAFTLIAGGRGATVPATAINRGTRSVVPALASTPRVDDLVGRLTLDEKVSLLHQYQPAIPRLGIAAFKTGTEALHGVAWSTDCTTAAPS